MSGGNTEARALRDEAIRRFRSGIRSALLRVRLDELRGRETPEAVVRLAHRTPPPLLSPFETLRTPDGSLRKDPEARREMARYFRQAIRAAQLRVALDAQRGRPTPEAVKRIAQRSLPELD